MYTEKRGRGTILVAIESSSKEHTTRAYQVLVNYYTLTGFQVSASTRAGVPISVSVLNTLTESDCACRGHGQACVDRRILLVSQTVVEFIQLLIWSDCPVVSEETRTEKAFQ